MVNSAGVGVGTVVVASSVIDVGCASSGAGVVDSGVAGISDLDAQPRSRANTRRIIAKTARIFMLTYFDSFSAWDSSSHNKSFTIGTQV